MNRSIEASMNRVIAQDLQHFLRIVEAKKENRRQLFRTVIYSIVMAFIFAVVCVSAFTSEQPEMEVEIPPIQLAVEEVPI
ncbi:hypothetical protein [Pelobacter propionicus]|nr:hypothetical protein [Pelobacter propionicus]